MYIQQFGVILEESKLGVNCDNLIIPGFFFADDMVLITESRADLEKQLSLLTDFCFKKQLEINADKTKIMIINGNDSNRLDWSIKINNDRQTLEVIDSFKYLCMIIGSGRNIYREYNEEIYRKMKRYGGILKIKSTDSFN